MSSPVVSVVIPTFNRAGLLPRALDSVIRQTFSDWEIVLVDDGSTDQTPELAQSYASRLGDRLQFVRRANTGCCGARNAGIDASRGSYVAFLDSDDEFLPTKLARQLELFELRPELGLVYSDYAYVNLAGDHFSSAFNTHARLAREVPYEVVGPQFCVCTRSPFDVLIRGYFIATIVGMVRREVLSDNIRFSSDPSYSAEWLFYMRIARACAVGFVDEALCLHHFVQGSVTRTDSHRNLIRLRDLLQKIRGAFPDMPRRHLKVLRHKYAENSRQLGYNFWKRGDPFSATQYLWDACRHKPNPKAAYDLLHVLISIPGRAAPTHDSESTKIAR